MARRIGPKTQALLLEAIVDSLGMETVTEKLADIAREKADHVRSNWQDEHLAKAWEAAARLLDKSAREMPLNLPR